MQNYELWLSGQPDIILTQTIRVQFLPVFLSSMEIVKTKAYYESIISLFDFLLRSTYPADFWQKKTCSSTLGFKPGASPLLNAFEISP